LYHDLSPAQCRLLKRIELATWVCVATFLVLFSGFIGSVRAMVAPDWQLAVCVGLMAATTFAMAVLHNRIVLGLAAKQLRAEQRLVGERDRAEAALRHLALHDSLTGLANRRMLYERLDQAIDAAQRRDAGTAVLVLDLDGLKKINDALGHQYGDGLLREVAGRWATTLRSGTTGRADALSTTLLARVGGDEFAVLLTGVTGYAEVAMAAQRLHAALDEPIVLDGERLKAGVSIGAAIWHAPGTDADSLIRHADRAMYEAKRAGGGWRLASAEPVNLVRPVGVGVAV
jgi:diguanylate cyclase (GGDEF)-like protein